VVFALVPRVVVFVGAVVGVAVVALELGGCAHSVRVESNVPEAVVRVDGEPKGTVKDGATFTERWGFDAVYDVDVAAPGHRIERRRLRPAQAEPAVAVPAILGGVGGCVAGGCLLPVAALSSTDTTSFYGWSALSALTLATSAGACAIGFGASERLPDVVTIDLVREVGAGTDGDLPPPPVDAGEASPLPPPDDTVSPAQATSGAGAATLRW
jgi:hypothetical protein